MMNWISYFNEVLFIMLSLNKMNFRSCAPADSPDIHVCVSPWVGVEAGLQVSQNKDQEE